MKVLKKFLFVVLFAIMIVPLASFAETAPTKEKVPIYFFHRTGCGFCANAQAFFDSIQDEYGNYYELVSYEVSSSEEYMNLMDQVGSYFGETVEGVPYIVIGSKTFPGYIASWDEDIKEAIMTEYNNGQRTDAVQAVKNGDKNFNGSNITTEEKQNNIVPICIFGGIVLVAIGLIWFARKKSND